MDIALYRGNEEFVPVDWAAIEALDAEVDREGSLAAAMAALEAAGIQVDGARPDLQKVLAPGVNSGDEVMELGSRHSGHRGRKRRPPRNSRGSNYLPSGARLRKKKKKKQKRKNKKKKK